MRMILRENVSAARGGRYASSTGAHLISTSVTEHESGGGRAKIGTREKIRQKIDLLRDL